ncbi:hypothetical protein CLD22_20865, partial [Rubrivivax gelatinosus]|nr:hypothetical protein [Rubrivivax gelatinosus]
MRGREPSGPAPGVAPAAPGTAPPMPPLPTAAAPAMSAAIVELPAGVSVGDVLKLAVLSYNEIPESREVSVIGSLG